MSGVRVIQSNRRGRIRLRPGTEFAREIEAYYAPDASIRVLSAGRLINEFRELIVRNEYDAENHRTLRFAFIQGTNVYFKLQKLGGISVVDFARPLYADCLLTLTNVSEVLARSSFLQT